MRAVAAFAALPISDERSLVDIDVVRPAAVGRDLIVEVRAVSVNPVDVKRRARLEAGGSPRVLGYDAAGVVVAAGPEARLFRVGDAVYYAGAIDRPGTNAEYHAVDERIVGRKPANLDFAAAAALPLTGLTAWELMFERIGVEQGVGADRRSLLVIGGAGGVGSIAIQLARKLTSLKIIATASRDETRQWCEDSGAHLVIDHSRPMRPQLAALGLADVDIVLSLTASDRHLPEIAEMVAAQGHVGVIDDSKGFDFARFRLKSVSVHFEYMFSRAVFQTPDMAEQHAILSGIAGLVEAGEVRSTMSEIIGPIDAAHLRRAHARIESGRTRGKLVLSGFP